MSVVLETNKNNIDLSALDDEPEEKQAPENNEEGGSEEGEEEEEEEYEDPVERRKLIMSIQNYKNSILGKYLHDIDLSAAALEEKTLPDLEDTLREVRFLVGSRTNGNFWWTSFQYGLQATEYVALTYSPFKVQGLTFALSKSEEARELVTEISLKHQNMAYIEPEYRLGLMVMQSAFALHSMNSAKEECNVFLSQPTPSNISEKYRDI